MKKTVVCFLMTMMALGFRWNFPLPSQSPGEDAGATGAEVSYVTSLQTTYFQGKQEQNQARLFSLAKVERRASAGGAAYALSAEAGLQVGASGNPALFTAQPITVNRDGDGLLKNNQSGLAPMFALINRTLSGLVHRRMGSGVWSETIPLRLGDGFPEEVQAEFWVQPLPEPHGRWTLVSADSGLFSFSPLDRKFKDSPIYGRYRGILVYSPAANEFLQSASSFILYHGEDQFRLEQLQFAADESGRQRQPLLDAGAFLDFMPGPPAIAKPGAFPSWCSQAALLFDVLHLSLMTAAEGATNPVGPGLIEQSLIDLISRDYNAMEKFLGKAAADQFLGDWMKILKFSLEAGAGKVGKALLNLARDVGKEIGLNALPFGIGNIYRIFELQRDAIDAAQEQIRQDIQKLRPFQAKTATPAASSGGGEIESSVIKEGGPAKPHPRLSLPVMILGLAGGVALGLFLIQKLKKVSSPDGGDDCGSYWDKFKCGQVVNGIEYTGGLVPSRCDCPKNTHYAGMDNITPGGPWKICMCN
jgi:hypothetical protein